MTKAGHGKTKRRVKRRTAVAKPSHRPAARVELAITEERKRLARELHDELGQTLTAIKLELKRATELLEKEGTCPGGRERLHSMSALAESGLATIKRIATNLRLGTRDGHLVKAIHNEAAVFEFRTGMGVHLDCPAAATKKLTPNQQDTLFRIVQESLTNIVRHAGASAVRVRLAERDGHVELRVSDDGRGVTSAQVKDPRSLGLLGMRERTAMLAGTFTIAGRPGKGTVITVRVPVRAR